MKLEHHILIAEDDDAFAGQLASTLMEDGFIVTHVRDGSEAIKALKNTRFDLGFVDLSMPGMDGMEVIEQSIRIAPEVPIIMITGYATIRNAVKATQLGAYDFIEKPVSLDRLLLTARHALEKRQLEKKSQWMAEEVFKKYKMVGISPKMKAVYRKIDKIANIDSTVLITGETGTGKELAAMAIHLESARASGPFVKINCAAIPDTLIESELFGHKKGAFTNALSDKKGLFLLADGGTLLLDEIGDMSPRAQAKILRALQEQEIMPVGDIQTHKINVRVLAATNQNLAEKIAEKTFREDLYYRLEVLTVELPSLRERSEDIPVLVNHFLKQSCIEYNRFIKPLNSNVMSLFLGYHWPGNIRELKSVIEKLVILSSGDSITIKDANYALHGKDNQISKKQSYKEAMHEMERRYLTKMLSANDWNITKTADALSMSRANMYKKIQHLGIES